MEKSQPPMENPNDIPPGAIEVIKGHLYFVSRDAPPERPVTSSVRFVRSVNFATDPSFVYTSYFADFGPFDLGITHQFCHNLHTVMQEARDHRKFVVFYAGSHEHKRANAAACLMAYLVRKCMEDNCATRLTSSVSTVNRYSFSTSQSSVLTGPSAG